MIASPGGGWPYLLRHGKAVFRATTISLAALKLGTEGRLLYTLVAMVWIHKGRIAVCDYSLKRAPRKKPKQPPIANVIITPPKLKPLKGPVIRLGAQIPKRTEFPPAETQPKRPMIIEPKRKRSRRAVPGRDE